MIYRTTTVENREALIRIMTEGIRSKMDVAVLGVSGGADSTLVAILASIALGRESVYAVSMPYADTDVAFFNARSSRVAEKLRLHHTNMTIKAAADTFIQTATKGFEPAAGKLSDLQAGNIRSRCRMVYLYAFCGLLGEELPGKRVRVIGTGNLSEDFIGFDTKGGDALCDYFPIGGLYKQEVYDLLDHFKALGILTEDMIDRVPSAGLWEGQTDEGELGHSYNEMAPAVELLKSWQFLYGSKADETIANLLSERTTNRNEGVSWDLLDFVWKRHITNRHKHVGPEVCELPVRL